MTGSPSFLNRFAAHRQREVSTGDLEAFRRAGAAVYDLALVVEQRRADLAAEGRHPWDSGAATSSLLLATWNARALQALGTELLESDRRSDPRTAGFVPVVTHRQAWSYFEPVAMWISLARRAEANDDYWIAADTTLPAALPPLLDVRPAPGKHLRGLLSAGDALDGLLEQELSCVLTAGEPPARYRGILPRIEELAAQARSSLHYAQGLWHPDSSRELDEVIRGHLSPALVLQHHVGQFLALPELVLSYRSSGPLRP